MRCLRMLSKEELTIIIATKDRPNELIRLLESIDQGAFKPGETLIIDGGETPLKGLSKRDRFKDLNIRYVEKRPASLPMQRNIGVKALGDTATLIAFFDDDIVIEKDSLLNMMKFWESASPDTGGASFNNVSDRLRRPSILEKLFLVNTERPGMVMRSGFQSKQCQVAETIPVGWLSGCAMVYRRQVFEKFRFDEKFTGYAHCEDLDFSYRVGKGFKLFVVADARVRHLSNSESVTGASVTLGRMQVLNRLYFVKKNAELSSSLCLWACFGLFLNNLVKGIFLRDRNYLLRARGNISGFILSIFPH
ncbi:MAG: glycosyltransferase [Candidatus Omnitrophota bacterium]